MVEYTLQAALGVCYYPEHWPKKMWKEDAKQMRDLGLSWVRIGEFAWSRIEPSPGKFTWEWLDTSIDILGKAGLKIILGTPTATPPRWMVDLYPDMLAVNANGHPRKFGSRRHYCFSHIGYLTESRRICEIIAQRYGENEHIKAWQTDNEYGCHDTILSYSPAARNAFQDWLQKKYGTITNLNASWGNVFWSMEYDSFVQIDLPNLTVTEANPAHQMDFRRFSSDKVVAYNRIQCRAIQKHSEAPTIHNYMGRITDFDHFKVGKDLEIASWDSYPLGFLEDRNEADEAFKHEYQKQGDPDFQALHHDLYRAVGYMKSSTPRWWVMEQQPGPVNWAPYNPIPHKNMVRLWTWEAIAHGAEVVSYFRWRQAPFAQEQMHSGLQRPDGIRAQGGIEAFQVAAELAKVGEIEHQSADVAIVFDYASAWAWDIQPQGRDFDYFRLILDFYRGLRKLGLSIDILPSTTSDFGDRKLILIPGLFSWNKELKTAVKGFDGQILIGPRTGSKTDDFSIPETLPPNISDFTCKIIAVESLRPSLKIPLENGGHFHIWREIAESTENIVESTADNYPAILQKDTMSYLCGWPDADTMVRILEKFANEASIETHRLHGGHRIRQLGKLTLHINYGLETVTWNDQTLETGDVMIINDHTGTRII